VRKMTILKLLIISLFLAASVIGQTSAYQSKDGTTSIMLDNAKGNLSVNVTDTKFTFGYLRESGDAKTPMYGGDIFGKPATSLSTELFQRGSQPPQVGGDFAIGIHGLFSAPIDHQNPDHDLRDDWLLLQLTYSRSSLTTVSDAQTAPLKRTLDGYKAMIIWNGIIGTERAGTFLPGFAAGVQRKDNSDNLTPVQIFTPVFQSEPGVSSFQAVNQTSGYFGAYKKLFGAPIYSDFVYVPKWTNWLSADAYTRSDAAHTDRFIEGGIGLFVAQPKSPTQVLGGVSMGWHNGAPVLSVIAGWSF
jgi:hypothetical protein